MPDSPNHRRCSRCSKVFSSRRATDQHIRAVHKGRGERVAVAREDHASSMADQFIEKLISADL